MITYAKSFKTLIEAETFLNTLLLKEDFKIAKVANTGGDIYFIKPVKEEMETIVKECAEYANWYQANSIYTDISVAIKQHFGIK